MNVISYIFLLVVVESVAICFLKFFSIKNNNILYLLLGSILYSILGIIIAFTLKKSKIVNLFVYWNTSISIVALLIGWFIFGEFITFTNLVGIGISLTGIFLMNM